MCKVSFPPVVAGKRTLMAVGGVAMEFSPRLPFLRDPLPSAPVSGWTTILFAALGVLFIGLSKAGFGGGLGMLTTPLCVLAFGAGGKPPPFAVGVLLPLLCAGDAF